jgi:glycosyltransferase involved in cell wall biosynthesis
VKSVDATGDNKPLVSIGLPVYNCEGQLRQTLELPLAQDCEEFELIISDNASEDSTQEICLKYAAGDPRI